MVTLTPKEYTLLVHLACYAVNFHKEVPEGLLPEFYHTLSYEGDTALHKELNDIIQKYKLQAQDYLLP